MTHPGTRHCTTHNLINPSFPDGYFCSCTSLKAEGLLPDQNYLTVNDRKNTEITHLIRYDLIDISNHTLSFVCVRFVLYYHIYASSHVDQNKKCAGTIITKQYFKGNVILRQSWRWNNKIINGATFNQYNRQLITFYEVLSNTFCIRKKLFTQFSLFKGRNYNNCPHFSGKYEK